jgi:hypothetical protein
VNTGRLTPKQAKTFLGRSGERPLPKLARSRCRRKIFGRRTGGGKLSRGDGSRAITREAFLYALESVTVALYGVQRASQLEIDLGDEELFLRDLHEALQKLGGPQAWQVLVELGD